MPERTLKEISEEIDQLSRYAFARSLWTNDYIQTLNDERGALNA
jgi:hypothetical protein